MVNLQNQSKDLLDIIVGFAEIIGALGTAAAFIVTWLALREMQTQTKLANNPILKFRFKYFQRLLSDNPYNIHFVTGIHDQWAQIIRNNLEQSLDGLENKFLVIELTNSGKSEITQVQFSLTFNVRMFENDILTFITPSEDELQKDIVVELSELRSVVIPITNIRYFPIFSCSISGMRYRDIRGNWYNQPSDFDGPLYLNEVENRILFPVEPVGEEEPEPLDMIDEDEITF